MEAAAIRYACIHLGLCGIVMVEPAESQRPKPLMQDYTPPGQMIFPFGIIPRRLPAEHEGRYPLKVKNLVKFRRFPKHIARGTGVEEGKPVSEAWASGRPLQHDIPTWVCGPSGKWAYNAGCIRLGNSGMVLVLLWLPDYQLKLHSRDGVIL